MRQIAESAGLGDPDEVRHEPEHNEIVLIWEEEKLAVVVELDRVRACYAVPQWMSRCVSCAITRAAWSRRSRPARRSS